MKFPHCVFLDQNGTWRTLAVGVKDEGFKSRLAIKEEWRALRDQDLEGYLGHLEAYLEHLKFSETVCFAKVLTS